MSISVPADSTPSLPVGRTIRPISVGRKRPPGGRTPKLPAGRLEHKRTLKSDACITVVFQVPLLPEEMTSISRTRRAVTWDAEFGGVLPTHWIYRRR